MVLMVGRYFRTGILILLISQNLLKYIVSHTTTKQIRNIFFMKNPWRRNGLLSRWEKPSSTLSCVQTKDVRLVPQTTIKFWYELNFGRIFKGSYCNGIIWPPLPIALTTTLCKPFNNIQDQVNYTTAWFWKNLSNKSPYNKAVQNPLTYDLDIDIKWMWELRSQQNITQ